MPSEILEPEVVDRFEGLKKSTAQLRSECEGFQGFVVETLEQLEVMRGKLAEREVWVQAEYQRIDEQREAVTRLRDDLNQTRGDSSELERTILDLRQELDETKEDLEAQRQHADRCETENNESRELLENLRRELDASGAQREQLKAEREQLKAEREQLKAECEQLKAERGAGTQDSEGLADLVSQLDETQQELDEARQDLDATRSQLSEAREELERQRDSGPVAEPELLRELEEEREALEAELEQARHRAAELANAVAEQKQQFADERTGWNEELRVLRSLKDMHAPPSIAASASKAVSESGQAANPIPAGIGSSDPVVGSVLAQFAQLQKNVASRRSKSSE